MILSFRPDFLDLIRWALLLIGIVYVITQAGITSAPRVWFAKKNLFFLSLIYCPTCTSFWVGLVLGAIGFWPWEEDPAWFAAIQSAFAAMAVVKTWDYMTGGNPAYTLELPLLKREVEEDGGQASNQ